MGSKPHLPRCSYTTCSEILQSHLVPSATLEILMLDAGITSTQLFATGKHSCPTSRETNRIVDTEEQGHGGDLSEARRTLYDFGQYMHGVCWTSKHFSSLRSGDKKYKCQASLKRLKTTGTRVLEARNRSLVCSSQKCLLQKPS